MKEAAGGARMGNLPAIAAAAIGQYVMEEVITAAREAHATSKKKRRVRMSSRDILVALKLDRELRHFAGECIIPRSGAVVHPERGSH